VSEIVLLLSLLQWADLRGHSTKRLIYKGNRLISLWLAVGDCGAYRAAEQSFFREFQEAAGELAGVYF
jgi:hypothetical protein